MDNNITCSLVGADAEAQCGGWRDLGGSLRRSATIEDGISLWFDGTVEAELRELVAKEADCCSFLDLAVAPDEDEGAVRLDITSALPEARPVIDALGDLVGVGAADR